MSAGLIAQFETFIRRDPARRGLIGSEDQFGPLCPGHLEAAAQHLAAFGRRAAIVTGFFIPHGEPPSAETDGPPGAVFLAAALQHAGIDIVLVTDEHCASAVHVAARAGGLSADIVTTLPHGSALARQEFFLHGAGRDLTHLIAIERVGPSHHPVSLAAQVRAGDCPSSEFASRTRPEHHDRCHNMRGDCIDAHTADLHCLFEDLPRFHPQARTIGIGDGGNEIGMGAIPWEDLARRLTGDHSARVPCRIATDHTIVAGVSNWGGYALGAATLLLQNRHAALRPRDLAHEARVLEQLVAEGPAVDGVTRRQQPTVDGLPFLTYIQPWVGIRRLLGWDA